MFDRERIKQNKRMLCGVIYEILRADYPVRISYGLIYTEHGADRKQRRERGRKHMDSHVHEPADGEL